MNDLVRLDMLVPPELKSQMMAYAANNPEEFYSTTEVWIIAAREFLKNRGEYNE